MQIAAEEALKIGCAMRRQALHAQSVARLAAVAACRRRVSVPTRGLYFGPLPAHPAYSRSHLAAILIYRSWPVHRGRSGPSPTDFAVPLQLCQARGETRGAHGLGAGMLLTSNGRAFAQPRLCGGSDVCPCGARRPWQRSGSARNGRAKSSPRVLYAHRQSATAVAAMSEHP